jgi:hypothetical protein
LGSKRQPAPPPAPDPRQIAQTDAEFNRIDQSTPFGSLTYSGPSRNQANLTLSPELQALFSGQVGTDLGLNNLAQQALPGIGGLVNNPISTQGLPQLNMPQAPNNLPQNAQAFRGDIERQFFDRSAGLLNEQFGRDEERLRQTLANQGLQSGGQAFNDEFGQFNQRKGETFGNLARDAVLYGGQEASRSLSDQLGLSSLQNQFAQQQLQNAAGIRGQMLGEQQSLRGGQFNELASLLGLQQTQIPGMQNFFAPSQVGVGDAFALNQASQQNAFNQRSATARTAKGEMGDLIGAGLGYFGGKGAGR